MPTPDDYGLLPDGALGASHLRGVFYRMGFDDEDIVALSGAHTVGRCHADRSGFDGPWTEDPLTFDGAYFSLLLECDWQPVTVPATGKPQLACATEPSLMMLNVRRAAARTLAPAPLGSPARLSLARRGAAQTDVALISDPGFRPHVERFAKDQDAFFAAFVKAFVRLQENGHTRLRDVPLRK